jgi:hypothetical protein
MPSTESYHGEGGVISFSGGMMSYRRRGEIMPSMEACHGEGRVISFSGGMMTFSHGPPEKEGPQEPHRAHPAYDHPAQGLWNMHTSNFRSGSGQNSSFCCRSTA